MLEKALLERFGTILNNIALKRGVQTNAPQTSFGTILNNIALKQALSKKLAFCCFGTILNNIALKPRNSLYNILAP